MKCIIDTMCFQSWRVIHPGWKWCRPYGDPLVFLLYFRVHVHTEKAQGVETELINSNREEVNQLKKIIAQKDEDLNRTVQRYELVLQVQQNTVTWNNFVNYRINVMFVAMVNKWIADKTALLKDSCFVSSLGNTIFSFVKHWRRRNLVKSLSLNFSIWSHNIQVSVNSLCIIRKRLTQTTTSLEV